MGKDLLSLRRRLAINIMLCVACMAIMYSSMFCAQGALAQAGVKDPFATMLPFYIVTTLLLAVWVIGIIHLTMRDRRVERLGDEYISEHEQLVQDNIVRDKTAESILSTYKQLTYIDLDNDMMEVIYSSWEPQFKKDSYSRVLGLYKTYGAIAEDDVDMFVETMSADNLRKKLADEDLLELEFRSANSSGSPEACIATVVVIDRKDGVPSCVALSIRSAEDLLTRDRAQRDMLRVAAEQAESASKAKDQFLSRVSHDMRTPLNAIKGMVALASMHIDDPESVRDALEKIDASSDHLVDIINDVLDITKIESGRMSLKELPLDLCELVESVRTMLEAAAHAKDIELRFSCEGLENPYVYGDVARLREMLVNVAGNSIKFTDPGGTVSVGVTEAGLESLGKRAYVFTVADNGIGMTPEFLERLFEPFSRSEEAISRKIDGTGLGMTITLNIVRLMGGDITVESEPGKGSCFKLNVFLGVVPDYVEPDGTLFPVSPAGSTIEQAKELRECDFSGKRALVVDDVDINAEIARELLSAAGVESESAADGKQALDLVLSRDPNYYDIVFMDVQMPVMNGHEAARRIREAALDGRPDLSDVPIIAMTANAFASDARDARVAGMDGHIAKPVNLKLLKSTLAEWLK